MSPSCSATLLNLDTEEKDKERGKAGRLFRQCWLEKPMVRFMYRPHEGSCSFSTFPPCCWCYSVRKITAGDSNLTGEIYPLSLNHLFSGVCSMCRYWDEIHKSLFNTCLRPLVAGYSQSVIFSHLRFTEVYARNFFPTTERGYRGVYIRTFLPLVIFKIMLLLCFVKVY